MRNSLYFLDLSIVRNGEIFNSDLGQKIYHFGVFADRLAQREDDAGLVASQAVQQLRQIFPKVLSDTEEHRQNVDGTRAGCYQFDSGAGEVGIDHFQVGAPHQQGWIEFGGPPRNRLDRLAPANIARSVREYDEASCGVHATLPCYRRNTSQPNAASDITV